MAKSINYSDLIRGVGTQDYSKIGKVSAESVKKHTNKDWKTWVALLEKVGARNWTYQEIVGFLKKKHRLTPWWQQGVAYGFEIATGRRKAGQDAKGKYTVTATKSLALEASAVWKRLLSAKGLQIWLRPLSAIRILPKVNFETKDGYFGEIRTVSQTPRVKKLRMFWQDPLWEKHSVLEVMLVARPKMKSILVFSHSGIPDEATKEILRTRWRKAADTLV